MKITRRQLRRLIREEKQKLREGSTVEDYNELVEIMEEVVQNYMAKTGQSRKMAEYEIQMAMGKVRRVK